MTQRQLQNIAFCFHLGVGLLTIFLSCIGAAFIFQHVAQGKFPWWVYPLFMVYIIAVFAAEELIVRMKAVKSAHEG